MQLIQSATTWCEAVAMISHLDSDRDETRREKNSTQILRAAAKIPFACATVCIMIAVGITPMCAVAQDAVVASLDYKCGA